VVTARLPTTPRSPSQHLVTRNTSQNVRCVHRSAHARRNDSNDLDRSGMRLIGLRRGLYLCENPNAAVVRDIRQMAGSCARTRAVGHCRIVS
jgi:hypothetical protein